MLNVKDLVIEALENKMIDVYRGTVKEETIEFWKNAKAERDRARDEFLKKKDDFWKQVYVELGLDPDKNYFIEPLTGQIFERVPVDEFKKDPRTSKGTEGEGEAE